MSDFDPVPVTLETVVSPEWLSAMLAGRWPGAQVREARVVELLARQATKVRLSLAVESGDDDVPTQICIKGVLTDTGAMPSASLVETLLYREAAAGLPVRMPDCIHASLSADGSRGVIVLRDVVAAGGSFCTALESFTPNRRSMGLISSCGCTSPAHPAALPSAWPGPGASLTRSRNARSYPRPSCRTCSTGRAVSASARRCAVPHGYSQVWNGSRQKYAVVRCAWSTVMPMPAMSIGRMMVSSGWSTGKFCKRVIGRRTWPITWPPC